MSDKLHDCKRGLATATSQDYNEWWRERERLTAENELLEAELEEWKDSCDPGVCRDMSKPITNKELLK